MENPSSPQPQVVQHEISPEMEKKLVGLAKKGIKIWIVYMVVVFVVMLGVATALYLFWFQPIFSNITDSQKQVDERMKSFDQRMNDKPGQMINDKTMEQKQQEFQDQFEKTNKTIDQTQETINSTIPTKTP